jgi:hypothetical protein
MRRSLIWALLATLAASATLVWVQRQAPGVVAAIERAGSRGELRLQRVAAPVFPPLPAQLTPVRLEPPRRDTSAAIAQRASRAGPLFGPHGHADR